jgi:hypothetical protein
MGSSEVTELLLSESSKTVRAIGAEKLIDVIINARRKPRATTEDKIETFIIEKCCEAFQMHPIKLKSSKTTYDDVLDVKMCCYVLLKKHLGYSLSQTKRVMDCNKSTISRSLNHYSRLRESVKHEKKLLDRLKNADESIGKGMKSIK